MLTDTCVVDSTLDPMSCSIISGGLVVSVGEDTGPALPRGLLLLQNYPNPFNSKTDMRFQITDHGLVSLRVYDLPGREVATLVNEMKEPGVHRVVFDASGLSSGVYFCRLISPDATIARKMLLIR
jgi:hypothetical protein